MVVELDSKNFKDQISKGWALVDFWAPWCGPCRMVSPVIEELSKEMSGVRFFKVNVDEQEELASEFHIMSIPTLMLFYNGELVDQHVGAGTKSAIKEWIEEGMKQK